MKWNAMGINRTNVADHLVEYQLDMIGRTIAEAYKTPEWYRDWTMTTAQYEKWKEYAIPLLKKVFRCNKGKAEQMFQWLNFQFGLRIDDDNQQIIEPEKL
jgi:hypothetical protein